MIRSFDELYCEIEEKALLCSDDIFLAAKREPQRPVVLYGAGGNCELGIYTCDSMMVPISCVCDSNAKKGQIYNYKNRSFYEVISVERLFEKYSDALILITTWQYDQEIKSSLCRCGFPENRIFSLTSPIRISPVEFRERYLNGYRWAYNMFQDARSRERVMDMIRNRLLGFPCYRDALYTDGYLSFPFPDEQLRDQEIYIDGGTYIGDTALEFIQKMQNANKPYRYIYSFDPEPQNCKIAKQNLEQYERVQIVPCGLWNDKTTLYLKYNPTDSDLIANYLVRSPDEETFNVPVTSLDIFFADKEESDWPTLIKMDIEGSENEALKGSEKIIKKKKPRLMISAYHKPEDIYELPQTILMIRDDYRFSLWKLGDGFHDMVLYAF